MNKKIISIYELLQCLTDAADLISPQLANHHQQVAYLAYHIGDQIGLSNEDKRDLIVAGLLHDIGALSVKERHFILENEAPNINDHGHKGAKLLSGFSHLKKAAKVIKHHHMPWDFGYGSEFEGEEVSMLSHIIHLADRIAVLVNHSNKVLEQIPDIREKIMAGSGKRFVPECVDAFYELSHKEFIWLDLTYKPLLNIMPKVIAFDIWEISWDDIIDLTRIFARIIDFRSHFTATHTSGVATVAVELGKLAGFSEIEQKMMQVAGYLHDLGKLAIPTEILEKAAPLEIEEFNIIKSHTFYTYRLLQNIDAFDTLSRWAAFHHERLDGSGYPFHIDRKELTLGCRIVAVADIFTAIAEDRPYRKGMDDEAIKKVLIDLVSKEAICPYITGLLLNNFDKVNNERIKQQSRAAKEYKEFFKD
jgi:putative nucleotidyltransferase with HDIG domain